MKRLTTEKLAKRLTSNYKMDYSAFKQMILVEPDREKALNRLKDIEKELEDYDEPDYLEYLKREDRTSESDESVNEARNMLLEAIEKYKKETDDV